MSRYDHYIIGIGQIENGGINKMAEPIKVERKENLSVTLWENTDKNGKKHKNIKIQMGYATKDTKDKPKEERKYEQKSIQIGENQIDTLIEMLQKMK